jgi:BirA family biotin operon repressor/biotin-[acetyl-CoA-carboxylase] ligase
MQRISPTLFSLIKVLNNLEIHSGESLGRILNISRNAVWKHINQLIKYQVPIKSWAGRGYQLLEPLILLDKLEIKKILDKENEDNSDLYIEIFGSIPSTNDQVKTQVKTQVRENSVGNSPSNFNEIQCCLAEHQTQGRGRFDRTWVSPFGKNLMLSAKILINKDMSSLGGISLCISLAILKALQELGIFDFAGRLGCKWPNDILYVPPNNSQYVQYAEAQKLSGVLIEAFAEGHGVTELIIGIGLNINMPEEAENLIKKISQPWTSLQKITGKLQDRSQVSALVIKNLKQVLKQFLEFGFESFQEEWSKYDLLLDKKISLKIGDQEVSGISRGVDAFGHLKIEDEYGKIKGYSSGEASVKKNI